MEKEKTKPTIKRRKNLFESKLQNISYDDLYFLYEKDCKLRNISEVTIKGYEFAHKKFKKFTGEDLRCDGVTQDLVNDYILELKDKHKAQTVNPYMFKISPVIKYGVKRGYIKDTIEFSRLVEQEYFKEIYTTQELELLLKRPEGDSFAQYRTWVIINLLLATGVRAKELRELRIMDVDIPEAILTLNHTKNRKPRAIPIPTSLVVILSEYLMVRAGADEEPLFCNIFGEPLPRTTLQISVVKYCKARGVEKNKPTSVQAYFYYSKCKKGNISIIFKKDYRSFKSKYFKSIL